MIALRVFGFETLAERWDYTASLLDASRWLWGARRIGPSLAGWSIHCGPLHLMVCRLAK
jgi:hypothetical protein